MNPFGDAPRAEPTRDRFGFALEDEELVELERGSAAVHNSTVLPRQRKAWAAIATVAEVAQGADVAAALKSMPKLKLKAMVRGGIPPELRRQVWPLLCGADAKRTALDDKDYYARLLSTVDAQEAADRLARTAAEGARVAGDAPRGSWELLDCVDQIEKDLGRTFPRHRLISTPDGISSLRRLLRAYCAGRNPRTGYCQGMNFLAGMLLVVMAYRDDRSCPVTTSAEEEDAFWMLVMLIERLLPADYYTDGLTGVRVDSQILLDLMRDRLPSLHAHLERTEVLPMMPMVTTQWFIALFVLWLPTETMLRLWDCFLADGLKSKNKTFFRAALTLFKMHEKQLIALSDMQSLMDGLRSFSGRTFDADALINLTYDKGWLGRFKSVTLHKREQIHRPEAAAEMARRAERQAARSPKPAGSSASAIATDETAEVDAELVAARMENISLVFSAAEGLAADEDDADDDEEEGEGEEDEARLPESVVDVSDMGDEAFIAAWRPRGYLLKRSPAASKALLKKLAWQRRWFEVDGEAQEFSWFASAKAAQKGHEPLGRVPLSMVITARQSTGSSSGFEVDLGNRQMQLSLDGVPKRLHAVAVKLWVQALVKHEVITEAADGSDSHRAKFWKVGSSHKASSKGAR